MSKLPLILAIKFAIFHYVTAVCNECNGNGVACISDTKFHPCINGKSNASMTFSCLGQNEICTKYGRVCMDKTLTTATPACGDTSNCGKCESEQDDGKFTCTSRTTFTMCSGGKLSEIRDTCPENQMCDIGLGKQGYIPCVPDCKESQIEFCDLNYAIDLPVTSTTELPTTTISTTTNDSSSTTTIKPTTKAPEITNTTQQTNTTVIVPTTQSPITTTTAIPAELVCSQQLEVGRYPYPNDSTCKKYIYCFRKGGVMLSVFLKCPDELYYNPSTTLCDSVKHNGCI